MKITSNNWNVTNTENLYKHFQQKQNVQNEPGNSKQSQELLSLQSSIEEPAMTSSVLSDKEMNVLKLFFGNRTENKEINFYGRQKPKNVNSGFFLDVKG